MRDARPVLRGAGGEIPPVYLPRFLRRRREILHCSLRINVSEVVRNAVWEGRGERSTGESVVLTIGKMVYTSREPKREPRLPLMFERTVKEAT